MKEIHHKRTLPFEQVPSWIAENRYLRTGYRKEGLSFWAYVGSLFRFHNETCNVWLHLFGAIFFVVLGCYITVLFVPGPTVHPHLAETGPAHEFLHKIEKTKHDLVLALATTNHTADVRDSIVAKLHAIEESLNQYSSQVCPQTPRSRVPSCKRVGALLRGAWSDCVSAPSSTLSLINWSTTPSSYSSRGPSAVSA